MHQFLDLSSYAEQMLVHEHALVKVREEMPLDRAALIRGLEDEFEAGPARDFGGDVDTFLSALDERGLITWDHGD